MASLRSVSSLSCLFIDMVEMNWISPLAYCRSPGNSCITKSYTQSHVVLERIPSAAVPLVTLCSHSFMASPEAINAHPL